MPLCQQSFQILWCVCVPFQVDQCLSSLQSEVENFILRMAAEFPLRKEQLLFLINNYDMMLSVLSVTFLPLLPSRLPSLHSLFSPLPLSSLLSGENIRRV